MLFGRFVTVLLFKGLRLNRKIQNWASPLAFSCDFSSLHNYSGFVPSLGYPEKLWLAHNSRLIRSWFFFALIFFALNSQTHFRRRISFTCTVSLLCATIIHRQKNRRAIIDYYQKFRDYKK